MWGVWLVTYCTYAESAQIGLAPPRLVAGPLSFGAASRMVEERGFGYCMKPWQP
jgi:hypothetical protein